MTLKELIISYREKNDLSQRQFAQKCDLSNGYISMLEKGTNPNTGLPVTPTIPVLTKLAKGMNLSLHQLFSLADDMPVDILSPMDMKIDNIIPFPDTKNIPLLGDIACGEPILAEENIDEYIKIDKDIPADFALRCKGDSMINARIFDGDIVYIRQQPDVENGEIAAVLIDNEATLKRVFKYPHRIELRAENPTVKPFEFSDEEINQVKILGKAVAFTSIIR